MSRRPERSRWAIRRCKRLSQAVRERSSQRRRTRSRVFSVFVASLLLGAGAMAVVPGLAWAAPFQRGDVFLTGGGNVTEYSPSGQLQQTIPAPGATVGCFDPSGKHLILPGSGLFDRSGNELPSIWAEVPAEPCAVDQFGHVYLSAGTFFPAGVSTGLAFSAYDLYGTLLHSYNAAICAGCLRTGETVGVAPDQCTIYYAGFWVRSARP